MHVQNLARSICPGERKSITTKSAFNVLFLLFWIQHTILDTYVTAIISKMTPIADFSDFFVPLLLTAVLLLALPYMVNNIRPRDVIFYAACIVILSLTIAICQSNASYIQNDFANMAFCVFPVYFLGLCYKNENLKKWIYYASVLSVLLAFAYHFYYISTGRLPGDYYMDTAYRFLPSAGFLIYYAFGSKKIIKWFFALAGIVLIFTYGTRGPILALLLLIAANVFFKVRKSKSIVVRILFLLLAVIIVFLLASGSMLANFMRDMANEFSRLGFSTRFFDKWLEGDITSSSGRDEIYDAIFSAIQHNPMGYGVMGDRVIIGMYCHNMFLEMWVDFGIIFGTLIAVLVVWIPVRALYLLRKSEDFFFVLMLFVIVFTKMMLSSSYLVEPYLFLLLGVSVGAIRKSKIKVDSRNTK